MNLLITGTAGFIGSSFVRQLLGQGFRQNPLLPPLGAADKLVSLDALTYAGDKNSLGPALTHPQHTFVKGDICDPQLVSRLLAEHKITAVLNFAAESHVDRSIEGSKPFLDTNVGGTLNLLDCARQWELKSGQKIRFVQVSTDEVYGALGPTGSFTESTPLAPNSPYSASKAAADCFVRSYFETHKMDVVTTRCTNNYGPYQFPEKFLPVAITSLMRGNKIPVYGQGLNVRDWLHVEDHCAGIYLALTAGKAGEVYNFGGFGERSNIDMARLVAKTFGQGDEAFRFVADRKGHDFRYSMDPKKAVSELSWKPVWTLEDGLAHTIDWYRANKNWWEPKLKA